MAIRKRGSSYQATVYIRGRRVATKTFPRRQQARDWEQKTTARFRDAPEVNGRCRFDQLIELYQVRHLSTKSDNTQNRYQLEIDARLLPAFSGWQLDKITAGEIEVLKVKLRQEMGEARSVNYTLETLRAIFNKAVKWKLATHNPVNEVDFLPVDVKTKDWLQTADEIQAVMAHASGKPVYPIILLALEAGLRVGEILGLQFHDFDLESGNIRVARQWLNTKREYGPPKHRIIRYVPMSRNLIDFASDLRPTVAQGPVFVSPTGLPPQQSSVYDSVTAITKKAVGRSLGLHAFRHTFGSWYMRVHDDMWTLSRLMGHSNIETTRKYCHQGSRHKAKALDFGIVHTPSTRQNLSESEENKSDEKGLGQCSERDLNSIELFSWAS